MAALPHSMHAYFLLPGDPKVPIIYDVDRMRDGKSFTTRRVTARQHGHPIFSMLVSFHADEDGLDHQAKMPDVPPPEKLPSDAEMREKLLPMMPESVRSYYERERPIELRPVEFDRYLGKKYPDGRFNVWIRATSKLPDDPAIHQCALAYASDLTLLDTALVPHGRTLFEKEFMAASLDHALWLHRPFRADDWLLYAQDTPNLHGSRGFARGLIFTRDGTLVASVAQEGLVRLREGRTMMMRSRAACCRRCWRRAALTPPATARPRRPAHFPARRQQYTQFSAAELTRGFLALAFGSDLRIGARPKGMRRFDRPIRAVVIAGGSVDRAAAMQRVLFEIRARRFPICTCAIGGGNDGADIDIRLIDEKNFSRRAARPPSGAKSRAPSSPSTDPQCMTNVQSGADGAIIHADLLHHRRQRRRCLSRLRLSRVAARLRPVEPRSAQSLDHAQPEPHGRLPDRLRPRAADAAL